MVLIFSTNFFNMTFSSRAPESGDPGPDGQNVTDRACKVKGSFSIHNNIFIRTYVIVGPIRTLHNFLAFTSSKNYFRQIL